MKVVRLYEASYKSAHRVLVSVPVNSRILSFTEVNGYTFLRVLCDDSKRGFIDLHFCALRSSEHFEDEFNGELGDYINSVDNYNFFKMMETHG